MALSSSVIDLRNPIQGGVANNSRLLLCDIRDISNHTTGGDGKITAITLKTGCSFASFDGIRQSVKPSFERIGSDSGLSTYKHAISFSYFDYSQNARNNLTEMANSRYVAIIENAVKNENSFEVFGIGTGLEVATAKRTQQENDGAFMIELSSPENERENRPPAIFGSSLLYDTNLTAVNALIFLPTISSSGLSITTGPASGGTSITVTGTNFLANTPNSAVLSTSFVDVVTGEVRASTFNYATVTNTMVVVNSPALVAGSSYKIRITTTKGYCDSPQQFRAT